MLENLACEGLGEYVLQDLCLPDYPAVLDKARVPEHSLNFMRVMSSGEPFLVGDYLFLAGDGWLLAVGYPLQGGYDPADFQEALEQAKRRVQPQHCRAVAPGLPSSLLQHTEERDHYYVLSASAHVQPRLLRLAEKTAVGLRTGLSREFTAEHERLWEEFTGSRDLPPRVQFMYEHTARVMAANEDLVLLDAREENGRLAASLLLDLAPRRFLSYMIGARSLHNATPYATDLLFRDMLYLARERSKEFIHLGLGVNKGISRFKRKWGGEPVHSYELAVWRERSRASVQSMSQDLSRLLVEKDDKWKILQELPQQRRLNMLWELELHGRRSWIAGSAHFCPHSYESHLRKLFQEVDTVLCEGPLDRVSMGMVDEVGRSPRTDSPRLATMLTEEEIRQLEGVVSGPRGFWATLFGLSDSQSPDVRYYLEQTRHWMAFYGLWAAYLRRQGWRQSVDMEAWNNAWDMGKYVLGMESIPEQLNTLENIPVERIVRYFRNCREWSKFVKLGEQAYLEGDLEALMGTSAEFPSRTELVIYHRDERFLQRMQPFLRRGGCAVFVGTAHMLNLLPMLRQAGFRVRQCV